MLSNPDTDREYDENLEVSEFSDYESGDESENGDDEPSYNEDWDAPPSEAPSDNEDESIPDGMECVICGGCRQITVQFASCSHGTCNTCLKGIYRSRRRGDDHFPTWFPCHICRAEIRYVSEISQQEDFCDSAVRCEMHGEVMCTIWNWVPVRRWMAKRSRTVVVGLMKRAMRVWCTPSSDSSSDISMSDDTPSIYVEGRLGTT